MLRKVALSATPLCLGAAALTISANSNKVHAAEPVKEGMEHYKCKPADLPIYTPLHSKNKKPEPEKVPELIRPHVENGISVVRKEVFGVYNAVASKKKVLDDTWAKGKDQTKFVVDYLNEPANTMPRVGAVAIGGLAGFIFALRGGFIRRVLFTGIGAAGVASICYPKDAEVYAQHGIVEAKKYANIAYNFAFGVKPGDDVNAPDWPKIPTNFSELGDTISDITKSAKDAMFAAKK